MAGDMQLQLKLNLDSKQYTAALLAAGQQVQQFSGQLQTADTAAQAMGNAIAKVGHYGAGLFALNQVGGLARGFIQTADAVTTLNNTLRLSTGSAQAAGQAYTALFDIAQRSRVSFTELGSTFVSLNRAGQEMGVSQQRMLAVTEAVGNAMTISGGSAASMQAALVQLGQGMASGVLRGEELNSVMEQAPRLARALADGMGVPLGKLRELGSEGKITADQVVHALESQAAVLRGEVTGATMTASQAFTQLSNATTDAIGKLDAATGASAAVAAAISGLATGVTAAGQAFKNNAGAITTTLGVLGGAATAAGVLKVAGAIQGAGGTVAAIAAVRTAFLGLSAVMAANPVGLALLGIGAATGAAIAMNSNRTGTMEGLAREIENTSARIAKAQATLDAAGGAGQGELTRKLEERIAAMRKYLGELQQNLAAQEGAQLDTRAEDERNARHTAQMKAQKQAEEELAKFRQKATGLPDSYFANMEQAISLNQRGLLVGKEWDEFLKQQQKDAQKHLNPQEKTKAAGGITVSDAQLANLQGQLQAARLYGEQLATLGAGASQLNAGERESLEIGAQLARVTDAKTIARLQEKQAIADALGVQLRSNAGLEQSFKAHQALIDATAQDADALNQRAAAQEAANQVFGKGRTAIEEMTLAELQKQMAEAQGSDSFDPKYIASLELKIAAQKRWVGALQGADYKAAEQHVNELLRGAQELARAYEDEQALSGLTALEREKLVALRQVELKYAKELAAIDATALKDTEKQALRDKAHEARRIEGAAAVAKAEQQHMARAADEINRSLTDALMRGFESGKDFAQNLADTTVNLFETMVLRPTISAIMTPVSLVINGVVQGGMNGVGIGGSSNLMGMASNASSLNTLYGTASQALYGGVAGASAASLGYANAVGLVGGDAIGALAAANGMWAGVATGAQAAAQSAIAANLALEAGTAAALPAGTISAATGGAAAGGGISGALASIPGWGWAAMAVLALVGSGVFNSRGANHSGGVYGTTGGDRSSIAASLGLSGNALGDFTQRGNTAIDAQLGTAVGALSGVYQSLAKYAGDSARQIDIVAGFALNGKHRDEDAYGYFKLIDKANGKVLADYAKRDGGLGNDPEGAWAQYVADMGGALVGEIRKADIPAWMDSIFAGMGDKITMDGLNGAMQQIAKIDGAFTQLGNSIEYLAGISGATQTALMELSGGIDGLMANASTYFENFYSAEEQRAAVQRQLQTAFDGLNLKLPDIDAADARAQFRSLVEAQDLTTEAGRKTYAALLGLSGAFAGVAQSAEDAAAAAKQLAEEQERARKAATDAAWAAMQKSIAAARDAAQAEMALRQERLASARAVVDLSRSQARELRGLVDGTVAMTAAQAGAYIDNALTAARSTGYLPDAEGLRQAITDARAGMGTDAFSSRLDYEAAQLILANKLDALGDVGDAQLTTDELLLQQAKNEVERLDLLIKTGREALDEARGNTVAVQGVEAAVKAFYDKLFAEKKDPNAGAAKPGGAFAIGGSGPDGGGGGGAPYDKNAAVRATVGLQLQLGDAKGLTHEDTAVLQAINAARYGTDITQADIAAAYGVGEDYIRSLFAGAGIPRFAAGGLHAGGLRLVGELGPELEVTGPARIHNARQTQQLLAGLAGGGSADVVAALEALRQQGYDIGRALIVLMQSMETLARKQDAIGVLQRVPA